MEGSESGQSKKSHLLKVWNQTGRMPTELQKVMDPPQEVMYLWEWLGDLVYPLSFVELKAWQELTARQLSAWEVRAMVELDKVRANG